MNIYPDYLILMLTDRCNLNCAYCYLGKNKSCNTMTTGTIDRALELSLASNRPFHVQLSGGEPTLAPDAVFYAAEKVRRLSPSSTLGLQTNATRIDRALADMMLQFNMDVGVSLDGPPRIQERLRGMARETFEGIKYLEEREIPFTVTTVVTRENLAHLDQLVLMLGGFINARGVGLDLLVNRGNAVNSHLPAEPAGPDSLVPEPHEVKAGIKKMVTTLDTVNRTRKIPIQLRERNRLASTLKGKGSASFCRAAVNKNLAVTPLGDIYPCTQTAFDPDFSWGTLENPNFMNSSCSLAGLPEKTKLDEENCHNCPLEGRCPGDCPGRIHYNGNAHLACAMYRALLIGTATGGGGRMLPLACIKN